MCALSVDNWLEYTRPHHVTLADLRNLEHGETIDVCVMHYRGWTVSVVGSTVAKEKLSPLAYFKEMYYARIRRTEAHSGVQNFDLIWIDTEHKFAPWVLNHSWTRRWIWLELADLVFFIVEDRGLPENKRTADRVREHVPEMLGVPFESMPGKCRIGYDGGAVMIRMDDMERMPQVYRPDKRT